MVAFVFADHFFTAAGITGETEALKLLCRRENPVPNQGIDQGIDAAGMAARIGHQRRPCDGRGTADFRKTVDPSVRRAVGGGGINHAGVAGLGHGHRFFGGGIRQAHKNKIRFFISLPPCRFAVTFFVGNRNQFQIPSALQPLMDAQPGGSVAAVDKYFCHL